MTSLSSMFPLDQWDLAPGEEISQSLPHRGTKRARDLLCPRPTLDTEQFILDEASFLNDSSLPDSSSPSSFHEFDLAPGEAFSETPPRGIPSCPTPPCPPPTLDTQEFLKDHPESEDAWLANDSAEGLHDVPDSLDGVTCESTEETTTSTALFQSRKTSASPEPLPVKKRIWLTSSVAPSRQDRPPVDKVASPAKHHKICDIVIPNREPSPPPVDMVASPAKHHNSYEIVIPNRQLNEGIHNSPQKEISSSDPFYLHGDAHLPIPLPGLSSENSTFRQPGQGPPGEPSPSKGCGNKDDSVEAEGDKSPHKHESDRRPNVLEQLSPNLYRKSSATSSTRRRKETLSDKENICVLEGKLHSDMTRPVAAKRKPLINVSTGKQLEDHTLRVTLNESRDLEPKAKIQKSLDAYASVEAHAGRDFSSKDSGWRNPKARKRFLIAVNSKQISLDRWLG